MNINGFTIISLFFSFLLLVVFFTKERVDSRETRLYALIIVINAVMGIVATLSHILIQFFSHMFITIFINKCLLISYTTWMFLFTLYLFTISMKFQRRNNQIKIILNFSAIVFYVVMNALIIILPIYFSNGENGVYSYGPSANMLYIATVGCIIVWMYSIIINYKNLTNKKYIPLYLMLLIGSIVVIIQKMYPELLLITSMFSYVTFIMYFTIENPDLKMINALNEAKLAAEKANRAKSDFLSSMSHEIRTPLNAIVGFSDCILEEESLESAKSDANDIKLASENLLEIVNGILDISKIEADKMEIVETDYNPLETLENVVKLVKPRIQDKPIELFTKIAPDIPYILHGDGGKLRQIITNILTNAAKYTEEGRITFYVNCVNEDDLCNLVISVEDTGRGIKPEQIDKLFTKFQRLDEDKNTTLEGTGLGLAITKRFVEMMGEKIVVQSKYGEGSKFTVYLKQQIVTLNKPFGEETPQNDLSNIKVDLTNAKVLLVDDNKINVKVGLKLLSNYGINADSCYSGADCLDLINTGKRYDLILLDDMMPRMSGVETLKRLNQIDGFNMPVVALTANAIMGMREKYLADGFNDYLSKPIDKNELYRVLVSYINKTNKVSEVRNDSEITREIQTVAVDYLDCTGKKALIVDDNKINIKIAEKFVLNYKFAIDSCLSGEECIKLVKENKYDIIFLDYMMPGMDGIETLNHLKEIDGFNTPVVCLTADAVEGSKEKFLNAGFDEYIPKPIDRDLMDEVIKRNIK